MWTEQDDYDEETDMLIFGMMDDEKSSSGGNSGGGCLIFMIGLIGIAALPIIGTAMLIMS